MLSLFNRVNANNSIWLEQQAWLSIYFQVYKALVHADWKEVSHWREFDCNVLFSKLILSFKNIIIANNIIWT